MIDDIDQHFISLSYIHHPTDKMTKIWIILMNSEHLSNTIRRILKVKLGLTTGSRSANAALLDPKHDPGDVVDQDRDCAPRQDRDDRP